MKSLNSESSTLTPFCACGCGERVALSRMHGREGQPNKYVNGHHNRVKKVAEHPESVADHLVTVVDLAWAAGFIEGEGSYSTSGVRGYPSVQATQVQAEPLERLRSMLGGRVFHGKTRNIWTWRVNGTRARGVMLTLWPMMSPRRRLQIERVLRLDNTITMRHGDTVQ